MLARCARKVPREKGPLAWQIRGPSTVSRTWGPPERVIVRHLAGGASLRGRVWAVRSITTAVELRFFVMPDTKFRGMIHRRPWRRSGNESVLSINTDGYAPQLDEGAEIGALHSSCAAASRQASKCCARILLYGGKSMLLCSPGTYRTVSSRWATDPQSALCRSKLPALANI